MTSTTRHQSGFTIIEMLVVVVVLAILAIVTIVAFNGVQERATRAIIQQDLKSADSQLNQDYLALNDTFPDALEDAREGNGLSFNEDATLYYIARNDDQPRSYCLTAVIGEIAYYINAGGAPQEGYCAEHDPDGAADAPTIATSSDSQTQITVSWDAVENAVSYELEWSTSGSFSPLNTVSDITSTSQPITGLSAGTTYYFRLYAVNEFNAVSDPSEVVSEDTQVAAPEGAPTIAAAANSPSQITVSWTAVSGATTYTLQRSTSSTFASGVSETPDLTGTSLAVTSLNAGTRYYFRMYVVSPGGNGPNSNSVNAITTISAPDSPSVSVSIPGSVRSASSGPWALTPSGSPSSGNWYYASAGVSSSTCASGTTRQQRARIQYNSPTTWGPWTSYTTASTFYAVQPNSGYGIRFQVQTRCYTSVYTSGGSSYGYGCRWRSGSTSCSGF